MAKNHAPITLRLRLPSAQQEFDRFFWGIFFSSATCKIFREAIEWLKLNHTSYFLYVVSTYRTQLPRKPMGVEVWPESFWDN